MKPDTREAFVLQFRPASEEPKQSSEGKECIVFNPCDGYHIGEAVFWDDGDFEGFRPFAQENLDKDFYTAWAELPGPNQMLALFPHRNDQEAS